MKLSLKIYLTGIYSLFAGIILFSWQGFELKQIITMSGFTVLMLLFNLEVVRDLQTNLTYSIIYPFVIPGFVYLEPFYAVLFLSFSTFMIFHKLIWYKSLFNAAVYGIVIFISSTIFHQAYPEITSVNQFYTTSFFLIMIALIFINIVLSNTLVFFVVSLDKGEFDLNGLIGLMSATKSSVLTSFLGAMNVLLYYYTSFLGVAILTFIGFFVKPAFQYRQIFDNELSTHTKFVLRILKSIDPITYTHSDRVKFWTVNLAEKIGLSKTEVRQLSHAASWHDIGKVKVPNEILNKPGKLTEEEYEIIKTHPEVGYELVQDMPFFQRFLTVIRFHHERIDGKGYPAGIKGEQIPFHARIMAIADAFDAMTSDRSYRKGMPLADAVKELKKHAGTQFDLILVEVFIEFLQETFGENYENFDEKMITDVNVN